MDRTQKLRDRALKALANGSMTIEEAWTGVIPDSHRILENEAAIAVVSKGATAHASDKEILTAATRLLNGDWGDITNPDDRGENEWNSWHESGPVVGSYQAQDGTMLWALQRHRLSPPIIMLMEER